jgi:cell division initiation protein
LLTPQEVTSKEFAKAKALFGGYDIAAVDEFLQQLTQDYAALYKENAILKNKLKVLVDKVEEYRSTEDAMRMALLSAQKTAREITENAQAESAKLLAETENAAEARKREILSELAAEEAALNKAKELTSSYINKLKSAALEYESSVDRIYDFVEPISQPDATAVASSPVISVVSPATGAASREDEIEETAKSIESSITKIFEQAISSVDEAAADEEAETEAVKSAEPAPVKPKIDYSNLQFGSNYGKK